MLRLFLLSLKRYLQLCGLALLAPFSAKRRLGGALLVIAGLPLFVAWQLGHWAGFLLDEILFRGYRSVEVRRPLFVIGPPRTGTTHLHHVLSLDPSTTTFRLWECLFGLSVSGRKLCLLLARLDRVLGRPVARSAGFLGRRFGSSIHDIHPLSLTDPEEDFLALMPLAACFLLAIPFPCATWLWQTARLDTEMPRDDRRHLMRYYRACIQRHLYVFGDDRQFLSKNASFAGSIDSLLEEFPDARILATTRDPLATVPSQLSSLRTALAACGFGDPPPSFNEDLLELMRHYYLKVADAFAAHPSRVALLYNAELHDALDASVGHALSQLGIPVSADFRAALAAASRVSRDHVSRHQYSLGEFGLDPAALRSRFRDVYLRYNFDIDSREPEPR